MRFVDLHERARCCQAQRTRLSTEAAPVEVGLHIILAERVRRAERLLNGRNERRAREIIAQRTPVHIPLAGARPDVQTAHGLLTPANRVRDGRVGHYLDSLDLRFRTLGCCAACGCSAPAYTRSLRRSFCRPSAFLGSMP